MNNKFKNFANSFQAVARLRLESITCLLRYLGNPQDDLKCIHVAGTNGKGSVCSFLQCIFTDAGYKTGKYISPNLINVCERISIDGIQISQSRIDSILSVVEMGAQKVKEELGEMPTQFELWTAAAFCYFKEEKCKIVVLETGLGGTRDATNVISAPLASVITGIALDHVEYLGETITQIAGEKAGIIKMTNGNKQGLTVSAIQTKEAENVLKESAREKNNEIVFVEAPIAKGHINYHEVFDYKSLKDVKCGITGNYQPENAALAIETALRLGVDKKYIKSGIERATNPARFEIINEKIPVIYDGAHNQNGMNALVNSLKKYFPDWKGATFIVAFMGDKDVSGAFMEIKKAGLDKNSKIFAVKVKENPRAAETDFICDVAATCGLDAVGMPSIKEAYVKALSLGKLTIVCGSLYLYKDFSEIDPWQFN